VATRRVRVPVAATYPLSDVAGAYERFSAGAKLGKVVLLMGGEAPPGDAPPEPRPGHS
jgi:hypothetical protein